MTAENNEYNIMITGNTMRSVTVKVHKLNKT